MDKEELQKVLDGYESRIAKLETEMKLLSDQKDNLNNTDIIKKKVRFMLPVEDSTGAVVIN